MFQHYKMYCVFLFVFAVLPVVQGGCGDHTDCVTCASSSLFNKKCRWCEETSTCHTPLSPYNSCKTCSDSDISKLCSVTEVGKCNRGTQNNEKSGKSGEFEPNEAFKATLYSAVAYTDDPRGCANTILPKGLLEIVELIGRKCNYLFEYKECFAFTAVSHEMKKIILAYRGTTQITQLIEEFATVLGRFKVFDKAGGKVQEYFSNANKEIYPCAKSSIEYLVNKYPNYKVIVTGHSLGGAIASIASAQLTSDKVIDKEKTTLYTFGMPRAGDQTYAENHDKLVPKSWRVVHFRDIVADLPARTYLLTSPYHHLREIFYGKDMELLSDYIECFEYEDPECRKSVSASPSSAGYHRRYYGISIGSHCDEKMNKRRKRSDADSDMSHLFKKDACKRIRIADLPNSAAVNYVYGVTSITSIFLLMKALRFV